MPFQFSEAHIANYMSDGYTVFQGIVPASLVKDLRVQADIGRRIARERNGPQAQRIQPVGKFELDPRPFQDYAELPDLVDAIHRVIGPEAWHGDPSMLGILLEPAGQPWCTEWHRDITRETPGVAPGDYEMVRSSLDMGNQVNCALYDDTSTWYVPGSHCREDLPSEVALNKARPANEQGKPVEGVTDEEQEQRCLAYCRAMPRAINLALGAGDFAMYRPVGWHLGNYVPYRIRATLHDIIWTPATQAWHAQWTERQKQIAAAA